MERRDALKYTAFFVGLGFSATTVSTLLAGCKTDTSEDWVPGFLSIEEAEFLDEFGETILPRTNTPGMKDAFVVRFIDTVRPLRFEAADNEKFKQDLSAFMIQAKNEIGHDFVKASPEKKLEWVTSVDKASFDYMKANQSQNPEPERPFYIVLKEHILGGYFSSETVAKNFFAFDPIPGRYDPCMPYAEIGKAWAL